MMKRSILCGLSILALAFSVGCGKKKDEKAGDKAGDMKAGDMKAGDTKPAEGDMKPTETAPAGGDVKSDTASICAKMEELATKEGGEALKGFNERLKPDCAKEIDEQRGKKGEQAIKDFAACLNTAATLSAAMDSCKQID
jgi:hypothetical protein